MRFQFGIEAPDRVEVIYSWHCCVCGIVSEMHSLGSEVQYPNWPGPGWKRLVSDNARWPGAWVCPDHKVEQVIS